MFITVLCLGMIVPSARDAFPKHVQAMLNKADSLELYSLDPNDSPDRKKTEEQYHGWNVLGKTTISDNKKVQDVVKQITAGVAQETIGAKCFWPRHGIRIKHDGKTVDLVICYECHWVYVHYEKENVVHLATTSVPAELLNTLLKEAKVPLPKQPEKK